MDAQQFCLVHPRPGLFTVIVCVSEFLFLKLPPDRRRLLEAADTPHFAHSLALHADPQATSSCALLSPSLSPSSPFFLFPMQTS